MAKGGIRVERQATGTEIWQVTTEKKKHSNIYCEVPYCSHDSRCFVYERRNPKREDKNSTEFVLVELGTWKRHVLDAGYERGICATAITHDGVFYYMKRRAKGGLGLMRADLATGKKQQVHELAYRNRIQTLGTVSADKRYYACGVRLDKANKAFGVLLIDVEKGTEEVIDRDTYIFNAHPQFEPGQSKQIMIQHNRGGRYGPNGKIQRSVGPEGATLYLLSAADGKRTTLQVGKPYSTPITGHEAWIGKTQEMLLSVSASGDFAPEKGNLLGVRAGAPARVVARGYRFAHVGVSRCGRFFCCDDWRGTYKLVIGSTKTGRTAVVCESKTKPARAQNTHPHPYLVPDLKWVIFNSNRSGHPHIYAASVPEGMIEGISKA